MQQVLIRQPDTPELELLAGPSGTCLGFHALDHVVLALRAATNREHNLRKTGSTWNLATAAMANAEKRENRS